MFIGDLVKLKDNLVKNGENKEFAEDGIKEEWIWLVTGMDNEDLDYVIQPLYLDGEDYFIDLGGTLMILYGEVEVIKLNRKELFAILKKQRCTC